MVTYDDWSAEDLERELAAKRKPKSRGRPSTSAPDAKPDPVGDPQCDPFPIDLLPVPIAELVTQAADVLVVPPGYVALPCLTTSAACIGSTRLAFAKDEFVEPSILWTAVVARTGTRKSAGYKLSLRRLQRHQDRWHDEYLAALSRYEAGEYEPGESGEDMERIKEPVEKQLYTVDTTVDALVDIMIASGRAAYVAIDEMDGWLAGMSRYTATSERGHWLMFYEGHKHTVNRRKDKHSRRVRAAGVCIHGGNQPLVLQRNLTPENIAAGLFGRFLFSREPEPKPEWHTRKIHPDTMREWEGVIDDLLELEHGVDQDGQQSPIVCKFSTDAAAAYGAWWEHWQNRARQTKNPGLAASRAKLVGQAVRLSLVLHNVDLVWRQRHGQFVRADVISEEWVMRGMKLCEWFDSQALLIYGEEAVNTGLLTRLHQMGKPVTARDLVTAKIFPTSDEASTALNDLAEAGKGEWSKEGKRKVFSLFDF